MKEEYITRKEALAAVKKIRAVYDEHDQFEAVNAASNIHYLLLHLTAAKVKPEVKGKWVESGKIALFPDDPIWACSVCDAKYFNRQRFCPYCGADMREDLP